MNNFLLLLKKEVWENWVNSKVVVVLSFFALFSVFAPYIAYQPYLSQFIVPDMTAASLLDGFYNSLAIFLIMFIPFMTMGTVASEVKNNNAASLLVKPTGRAGYIISKFLIYFLLFGLAVTVAVILSAIYANSLALNPNAFRDNVTWAALGLIWVFMAFAVSLMIFLSTITKSQVLAGVFGLLLLFLGFSFSYATSPSIIKCLPTSMFIWIHDLFHPSNIVNTYSPMWSAFIISLLSPIIFIASSIFIIKRKEL
jgi:ABC-2 type transport system permease protein